MKTSIYFIIGYPPNELFDSSRIGSYFPISNSLLLSSISKLFFDIPDQDFTIFGLGQKKDYTLLQHTNNKAYCQLGNNKDEFFYISPDKNIKFNLFLDIEMLFNGLFSKIAADQAQNILIILQDHGSIYQFNDYPYIQLLFQISKAKKNFLIYDDSCHSGSLIDMFEKNRELFLFFQKNENYNNNFIKRSAIPILYYFAWLQSYMIETLNDDISIFFDEFIDFLSNIPVKTNLFEYPFYQIIKEILNSCQNQNQEEPAKDIYTIINNDFFDKLKKDTKFDISSSIDRIKSNKYNDLDSFLSFLNKNHITKLYNLMMIKSYYEFVYDKPLITQFNLFSKENYKMFLDVKKVAFKIEEKASNNKTEKTERLNNLKKFFYQYIKDDPPLFFFDFNSNLEIITSTSLEKISLSYSSISVNSITKVFPNTPGFAYFIQKSFFNYEEHVFEFIDFEKHIYGDQRKKKRILFPSYTYRNFKKPPSLIKLYLLPPQHLTYPYEEKSAFNFQPSLSLPNRIAAVRFLTYFVKEYLSNIQKTEYFPKLNFSCGFSRIPSDLLINFISLSILPSSDAFPSDLELYNESFLSVIKFANLIFQTSSAMTSINKQPKQFSINKDRFEFTTFFSVVLSSKIRYTFAKNLLLILNQQSDFHKSIHLFSSIELEYTKQFLESENLDVCTDGSAESTKQFLDQLFSESLIKKYYSITPPKKQKSKKLKKSPKFILQKMFLDLESSILNILPSDAFVFSIIYSYLLLKYHKDYDKNPPIKEDIQNINITLFQLFDEIRIKKIIEKIKTFNFLIDILQFCNNYISKSLQKTFDFLEYFYQTYYYVSFCKVSNQYNSVPNLFNNFQKIIPNNSDQKGFFDSLTTKLKPFPLFCLPFILFCQNTYNSYEKNLEFFFSTKEIKDFPDSISLFESNFFYSQQFRIHLSNLSLYSELKKSVIDNIKILNTFLDANNDEFSDLMSQSFFKNPFPTSKSFEFICEESTKFNVIEFLLSHDNTNIKTHIKQSISSFIKEFISTTNQFLQFGLEEIVELDYTSCTHVDDFQLFFCTDKENKVYIESISNNIANLINILSISNSKPNLTNFIKKDIVNLAYSILIARFNNKVEIEPIVKLISNYEDFGFSQRDWIDPSNREFMALCSAVQFYPRSCVDKKEEMEEEEEEEEEVRRKRRKRKKRLEDDEEEDYYYYYYSPPISASNSPIKIIRNYRNEFSGDNNNVNAPPSIREPTYVSLIDEALNISATEIYNLNEKYDIRRKNWKEIIWSIFYDFFNKKLKEINLNFDINNDYSQGFSGIDCLNTENSIIMNYFPQLNYVKDLHEKNICIGCFICLHKENESEIKSAYLYAIMSSYAFLRIYYTFDIF
ncbi:hypothetical protein M9Y10_019370 [Tritrichomonas musculus]|uniref:Caspase family p20 domain-containing protein n=1 Tax=Tritrichomonas musculus TaxID=1915356 RepID=A0ABR2HKR1_9EUKA